MKFKRTMAFALSATMILETLTVPVAAEGFDWTEEEEIVFDEEAAADLAEDIIFDVREEADLTDIPEVYGADGDDVDLILDENAYIGSDESISETEINWFPDEDNEETEEDWLWNVKYADGEEVTDANTPVTPASGSIWEVGSYNGWVEWKLDEQGVLTFSGKKGSYSDYDVYVHYSKVNQYIP